MAVRHEGGIDAGLIWHLGNPVAEARQLAAGRGVVALENREVLEISGADRLGLLHALTTQHFEQVRPGDTTTALVLSPTGHIEQVLYATDDGNSVLAWTEPGHGQAVVDFFNRMKFAMRADAVLRPDLKVCWFGLAEEVSPDWRTRQSAISGVEAFVPADDLPESTAGTWAFEAARIALGVPRVFVDTDHKTIPNEIGLLGTHLEKGCYRGQETVARVHTLGRPPRRLVQLHLDGTESTLPAVGAPVTLEDRVVGFVGTSALHHELGPIALAMVKRNVDVAAQLWADGIAAAQEILVDPEVGLHVRPRLR